MLAGIKRALYGMTLFFSTSLLMAQEGSDGTWGLTLQAIVSTIIYSVIGLVVLLLAYKVFDWVTPYDFKKELSEDDNTAIGAMLAGVFIALAIIIAAAIV